MKSGVNKFISVVLVISFCLVSFINTALAAPNPLARDLVKLTTWFEGQFDNGGQVWFENDRRWTGVEDDKHRRNHASHLRVIAPEFGEHVFYVEEYMDDDTSNIWRQRLVSFDADTDRGLRMRIYFLNNADNYNLDNAGKLIGNLGKDGASNLPECDVYFKRVGTQYHGQMDPKACAFGEGDKRRYSVHNMFVSEHEYWRIDKTFLVSDDSLHAGEKAEEPSRMRRANIYTCEVKVPFISYIEPSPKDVAFKDIKVHSEGGTFEFTSPKDGKNYYLQLREKQYPYYKSGSDFLLMRLREVGAQTSVATVTVPPGTPKISVNVGSMLGFCQLLD